MIDFLIGWSPVFFLIAGGLGLIRYSQKGNT